MLVSQLSDKLKYFINITHGSNINFHRFSIVLWPFICRLCPINGGLNKKSLNLKRVLYPILYDDIPILFLDPFLVPYDYYIIYLD